MKKQIFLMPLLAACLIAAGFLSACTKSDNSDQQPTVKKEYRLFNQSGGVPLDAGTFTISQLADGNAALSINLSAGYRVENGKLPCSILTTDITGRELIYSNLNAVDGNTGAGITSPVVAADNNGAIKYTDLIAKTNYVIEVLNGGKVQARGIIN